MDRIIFNCDNYYLRGGAIFYVARGRTMTKPKKRDSAEAIARDLAVSGTRYRLYTKHRGVWMLSTEEVDALICRARALLRAKRKGEEVGHGSRLPSLRGFLRLPLA
jgi:hypothetical protein